MVPSAAGYEPPAEQEGTVPEPSGSGPESLPEPIGKATQDMAQAERRLASEDVVVAAPMSFHGSAARIWKLTRMGPDTAWATIGLGTLAVLLIACAWTFVLSWYVFFGLLLVPYRVVRRGQRKRKLDEARHRELMGSGPDR